MSEDKKEVEAPDSEAKPKQTAEEDEELSKLLDSALEDFTSPNKGDVQNLSSEGESRETKPTPPNCLWDEEFLREATAKFEQNVPSFFGTGDTPLTAEQIGENIQRLAEAATQAAGGESSPDMEFSNIIAQTLKNLYENTENIQGNFGEDEFMNMLGTFGNFADPTGDPGEFMPFVNNLLQSILSKEILLPAVTSFIEKYPQWIEDNKSKMTSREYEQSSEQLRVLREVRAELEKDSDSDTPEEKKARLERIMHLMQQMQDCGQLPPDIVGDFGPMMNFDNQGNHQLPANLSPNQCNIM